MVDSEFQSLSFLFRQLGPHHRLRPAQSGAPGKPQSGPTVRTRGVAPPCGGQGLHGLGSRPRGRRGRRGGGYCTFPAPAPPGPSRRLLRCGPAPLHAAPPPLPTRLQRLPRRRRRWPRRRTQHLKAAAAVVAAVRDPELPVSGGSALRPEKTQWSQEGRRSLLEGVRYDSAI